MVFFSDFAAGMSSNTSALLLLTIDDIQSGIILALNLKSLNQQICDVSSVERWIGMHGRGRVTSFMPKLGDENNKAGIGGQWWRE